MQFHAVHCCSLPPSPKSATTLETIEPTPDRSDRGLRANHISKCLKININIDTQ